MKGRLAALLLCITLILGLAACGNTNQPHDSESAPVPVISAGDPPATGAQIAFIITEDQRDTAFTRAAWNEISRFAGEEGITYGNYQAENNDPDAALATLELAVTGGAKLVVSAGDELAGMVQQGQALYPELEFVLIGAQDSFAPAANTVLVEFSCEQAGWLAGYAAVWESARRLAYLQPASEESLRYALGFLQGAEDAAAERSSRPGDVQVLMLQNGEEPDEEADGPPASDETGGAPASSKGGATAFSSSGTSSPVVSSVALSAPVESGAEANNWQMDEPSTSSSGDASVLPENAVYHQPISFVDFAAEETAVLFANAPLHQEKALRLAREAGAEVIGVGTRLLTSQPRPLAVIQKKPGRALYSLLANWRTGALSGGEQVSWGVANGCVGLSMDNSNFTRFGESRYEKALAMFDDGTLARRLERLAARALEEGLALQEVLRLEHVQFYSPPPPVPESYPMSGGGEELPAQDEPPAAGQPPPVSTPPQSAEEESTASSSKAASGKPASASLADTGEEKPAPAPSSQLPESAPAPTTGPPPDAA